MINVPLEWKPFPCVTSRLVESSTDVNRRRNFLKMKEEAKAQKK